MILRGPTASTIVPAPEEGFRVSVRAVGAAIMLLILTPPPVLADPPFPGTAYLSPDIITSADLSALTDVTYTGRGGRTI